MSILTFLHEDELPDCKVKVTMRAFVCASHVDVVFGWYEHESVFVVAALAFARIVERIELSYMDISNMFIKRACLWSLF